MFFFNLKHKKNYAICRMRKTYKIKARKKKPLNFTAPLNKQKTKHFNQQQKKKQAEA